MIQCACFILQSGSLCIAVTETCPEEWKRQGEKGPIWMKRTRTLATSDGQFYIDRKEKTGFCTAWTETFGAKHAVKEHDLISVILTKQRSLTIGCNHVEVPNIFTNLPSGALWLIIYPYLESIEGENVYELAHHPQYYLIIGGSGV